MKRYVIDTSVLLHYIRGKEKFELIEAEVKLLNGQSLPIISSVTLGEINGFIQRRKWGNAKIERFQNMLKKIFIVDIAAQDKDLIEAYATIWNYSKNTLPGKPLGKSIGIQHNDVWIAATAKAANAILVTTDRDFDHLDKTFISVLKFAAD